MLPAAVFWGELLPGPHSQGIEGAPVCLPSLTEGHRRQHCDGRSTEKLEEAKHVPLEGKIILLSIPSEWS